MLNPTTDPNFQKLPASDRIGILQVLELVRQSLPAVAEHLHIDKGECQRLEVAELERLMRLED